MGMDGTNDGFELTTLLVQGAADVVFSRDHKLVFVAMLNGNIEVFDVSTGQKLASWDVGTSLRAISISDDGSYLLVVEGAPAAGQSTLYKVSTENGLFSTLSIDGQPFYDVEIVDADTALITGGQTQVTSLNLNTGIFSSLPDAVYSSNRSVLVEGSRYTLLAEPGISNGPLLLYDDQVGSIVARGDSYQSSNTGFNWGSQAVSEEAGLVVQFIYHATLNIYDLNLKFIKTVNVGGVVDGIVFDPSGKYAYVYLVDSGYVVKFETTSWTRVEQFYVGTSEWHNDIGYGNQLLIDPTGSYLTVLGRNAYGSSDNGSLHIIDLTIRNDFIQGSAGDDTINGGTGHDTIYGQAGDDLIGGQDGNDFLDGGVGRDTLNGHAGADHIVGGGDNDGVFGEDGNDLIGGQDGNDFIDGGNGRDRLYGDAGADHIVGGAENDAIFGQDGDDLIGGQDGDDFIDGGNGRDTLYGDAGADLIVGGSDNDSIFGQDGDDTVGGQDGDDFIDGGNGRDTLYGDAGADLIVGGSDSDSIFGQDGDDTVGGQNGDDFIDGSSGVDRLYGDAGNDLIVGGTEGDLIYGQDGDDLIGGQDGDDRIEGGAGVDRLYGDAGNDLIIGGTEGDLIYGQDGDDLIGGQDGDDRIEGGAGVDRLYGDAGNDLIIGGTEGDLIYGQDGDDVIGGQDGNDRIEGGAGIDRLYGDAGNDLIIGGTEGDLLYGQDGDDVIGGQDGDDLIDGGTGRDILYGDAGNDTIVGGSGADDLYGQAGADRFVFTATSDSLGGPGAGSDRILDFSRSEGDVIDLSIIDANSGTAANDAFAFVGTGAFSRTAGELRYEVIDGQTHLFADVDGDAVADMTFIVNIPTVQSSDFVL